MVRRALLALMFAIGLGLAACGGGKPPGGEATPAPAAVMDTCPVEGTVFPKGTGVDVEADGKRRQVCSRGCAIRFEAAPEKYRGGH